MGKMENIASLVFNLFFKVAMFRVKQRDAATLLPIIRAHVKPGSMIVSDGWAAYGGIRTLQRAFTHRWVNHKVNFVDPSDRRVHTQSIEATWGAFKRELKAKCGVPEDQLDGYMSTYMFRRYFGRKKLLNHLLIEMKYYKKEDVYDSSESEISTDESSDYDGGEDESDSSDPNHGDDDDEDGADSTVDDNNGYNDDDDNNSDDDNDDNNDYEDNGDNNDDDDYDDDDIQNEDESEFEEEQEGEQEEEQDEEQDEEKEDEEQDEEQDKEQDEEQEKNQEDEYEDEQEEEDQLTEAPTTKIFRKRKQFDSDRVSFAPKQRNERNNRAFTF
ncbi:hypothetical protein L3Y34_002496 [Caenorhabditis briggsae]|uniref:ISXO2-like transposase domain-containing protein n=1 Tax=Caenorhabditis briggsae TaxID=6238 RepID=A0AAE9DFK6_CAEBR|nr:hypothetical protein L3Y34_002496 [Caenorhabditis briggsae]